MAQVVTVKLDEALFERFEEQRKRLGMSRSTLLRMLVHDFLGDELKVAAFEEAYFGAAGAVRRATRRALDDMHETLPRYLAEESAS